MGYTYDELAEVLGKPSRDAARKAAHRALVRLAEEMAACGRETLVDELADAMLDDAHRLGSGRIERRRSARGRASGN